MNDMNVDAGEFHGYHEKKRKAPQTKRRERLPLQVKWMGFPSTTETNWWEKGQHTLFFFKLKDRKEAKSALNMFTHYTVGPHEHDTYSIE